MIQQIRINGYDDNFSYFVHDGKSKAVGIVDPGDLPRLTEEIEQGAFEVHSFLITHSHFDHHEALADMSKKYGAPTYIHKHGKGKLNIEDGMTIYIEDGDKIKIGDMHLKVMHTPGHINDAVCYYIDRKTAKDDVPKLITGDTIFVEGCGRADLEGSDVDELYRTIQRIKKLPDDTKIYPGHDYGSKPVSDLAWEKKHNKYFKCNSLKEFKKLRLGR